MNHPACRHRKLCKCTLSEACVEEVQYLKVVMVGLALQQHVHEVFEAKVLSLALIVEIPEGPPVIQMQHEPLLSWNRQILIPPAPHLSMTRALLRARGVHAIIALIAMINKLNRMWCPLSTKRFKPIAQPRVSTRVLRCTDAVSNAPSPGGHEACINKNSCRDAAQDSDTKMNELNTLTHEPFVT